MLEKIEKLHQYHLPSRIYQESSKKSTGVIHRNRLLLSENRLPKVVQKSIGVVYPDPSTTIIYWELFIESCSLRVVQKPIGVIYQELSIKIYKHGLPSVIFSYFNKGTKQPIRLSKTKNIIQFHCASQQYGGRLDSLTTLFLMGLEQGLETLDQILLELCQHHTNKNGLTLL